MPNQLNSLKRIAQIAFAIAFSLTTASVTSAQNVQFQFNAFTNQSTAGDEEELIEVLGLYIEELEVSLNLEARQTKKLDLTAKVVSKLLFKEQNNRIVLPFFNQGDSSQNDDLQQETFSDEDLESASETKPDEGVRMAPAVTLSNALNHATWKKAIKSVLTEEQQSQLELLEQQRNQEGRRIAVQSRVWQLAKRLRLRADQSKALAEVVDRIEGATLLQKLQLPAGMNFVMNAGGQKSKTIQPEDVEDILTAKQMARFRRIADGTAAANPLQQMLLGKKADKPKATSSDGAVFEEGAGGLTVKEVVEGSAAEKLGVAVGDIIDTVNDEPVDTLFQWKRALAENQEDLRVTVIRDGETFELSGR